MNVSLHKMVQLEITAGHVTCSMLHLVTSIGGKKTQIVNLNYASNSSNKWHFIFYVNADVNIIIFRLLINFRKQIKW